MSITGCDGDDVGRAGGDIGLAKGVRSPGDHDAGLLQQQSVVSNCGQRDAVGDSGEITAGLRDAAPPDDDAGVGRERVQPMSVCPAIGNSVAVSVGVCPVGNVSGIEP